MSQIVGVHLGIPWEVLIFRGSELSLLTFLVTFLLSSVTITSFSRILPCCKWLGLSHPQLWQDLISVDLLSLLGSRGGFLTL